MGMTPNGVLAERPPLRDEHGQLLEDEQGFLLPTHRTFASVWNSISQTYPYRWDEALKHSSQNALCMVRDAFLMGCLFERIYQLAELPWHLEPENAKDSRQVETTRELTNIVKGTDRWIQFATQIGWTTWYGRYGNQLLWKAKNIDGKPRLCVAKHAPVNGDKIQFGWDGTPRVMVGHHWISQHAPPGSKWANQNYFDNYPERDALINADPAAPTIYADRAPMLILRDPLWRERFVIHKHMCIDADYFDGEMAGGVHGVGLRSMIYWFFWLRDEMIGWAINHLKKIGVGGILIFYFDENNANSKTAAENAAKNAGERYAIAMPRPRGSGKDVEGAQLLPFNEAGVQSLTTIVQDYYERHIQRLIIGQDLSSKSEATGLGSAVANLHADTKYRILKFDADNLADTLSDDLVRVAQKWNFPGAGWRTHFVFDVPDPGADGKIGLATQLFATGMKIKAQNLRSIAGFEKPEEDDETVSQVQLLQEQTQIQAQMQQQQMQQEQAAQQQQAQVQQQQQAAEMQAKATQEMQGRKLDQAHQLNVAKQAQEHELAKLQQQQKHAMEAEQAKQAFTKQQAEESHGRAVEMERGKNPLFAPPEKDEGPSEEQMQMEQMIESILGPDWEDSDQSPAERLHLGGEDVDRMVGAGQEEQQQTQGQPGEEQAVVAQDGSLVVYKSEHAPPGGITLAGTKFVGGQFIPSGTLAKASPEERARLDRGEGDAPPEQPAPQQPQQAPEQPGQQAQEEPGAEPAGQEQGLAAIQDEGPKDPKTTAYVPEQQLGDLLRNAAIRLSKDEHYQPIMETIPKFAHLSEYDFPRLAGRAYQRAARAKALGQITQDSYDAAACRAIEKYRWGQMREMKKRIELAPVSKAALQTGRFANKAAGKIAKPIGQHFLGEATKGALRHAPAGQEKLWAKVHKVAVDVAVGAVIAAAQAGAAYATPIAISKMSGRPLPDTHQETEQPALYALGDKEPLPDPRDHDDERLAMLDILKQQKVDATPEECDDMLCVLDELFAGDSPTARPVVKA